MLKIRPCKNKFYFNYFPLWKIMYYEPRSTCVSEHMPSLLLYIHFLFLIVIIFVLASSTSLSHLLPPFPLSSSLLFFLLFSFLSLILSPGHIFIYNILIFFLYSLPIISLHPDISLSLLCLSFHNLFLFLHILCQPVCIINLHYYFNQ